MQNRTIYGTDRDTINDRDHLTSGEVERLKAAGVELDAREKRVLQAMSDQAFARARMTEHRATLARLDAEADASEAQRKAALKVAATSHPSAPDDFLIVTDHASPFQLFIDPQTFEGNREAPRRELVVRATGFTGCHWVPQDIAERVIENLSQRRLPFDYHWRRTPNDLLDAVYRAGTWDAPFWGASEATINAGDARRAANEAGSVAILRFATKVVDGCFDVPTLQLWLASASRGAGLQYQAFTARLRKRLSELDAPETAESEAAE